MFVDRQIYIMTIDVSRYRIGFACGTVAHNTQQVLVTIMKSASWTNPQFRIAFNRKFNVLKSTHGTFNIIFTIFKRTHNTNPHRH
jgi:hypothetical protein